MARRRSSEAEAERLRAQLAATHDLLEVQERTALEYARIAERAGEHAMLVDRVGAALGEMLDPDAVLDRLGELLVPVIADWFAVDLVEEDGVWRRVVIRHADPRHSEMAGFFEQFPTDPSRDDPPGRVARTGQPLLLAEIPEAVLVELARNEEFLDVARALHPRSGIIVAMRARGRTIGVVVLATAESGRRYDEQDLVLAQQIAERAALAVDNARLYQEAEAARRRYRDLVEGLEAVVWEAETRTGRLTFVSARVEGILGFPLSKWTSEPEFWTSVVHAEDRARVTALRRSAARRAKNFDVEYRSHTASGDVRWLRDVVHVVKDSAGRAQQFRGVTFDITAPKTAERRKEAQHHTARILAESATFDAAAEPVVRALCEWLEWDAGVVWCVDEASRTLRAAATWHRPEIDFGAMSQANMHAFAPGEGLPGRVWQAGEPAWIADILVDPNFPRRHAASQAGLRSAYAFPIIGEDTLGVIEFFTRRVSEPDADLLRDMATLGRQIGQFLERSQAEEEMRRSDARKTAILEAALDCVITIDRWGRVLEFNPAAEATFGYRRDEVVGRALADLIVPPQYRDAHRDGLERFRRSGEARIIGRRLELTAVRADGTEFPVELAITRVDIPGDPIFTGYIRDITQRKEDEAALRRSRERASFLAEASRLLTSSTDYETVLRLLADSAVPFIADWCLVDMVEPDGSLVRVAASVADRSRQDLAQVRGVGHRARVDLDAEHGLGAVVRTGRSEHARSIPDDAFVREAAGDVAYLRALRAAGFTSYMCVPLSARGRILGAMTFLTAESQREFVTGDLELAEELAARAALAIDNARLYSETSHIARTLQESLLPPHLPAIRGLDVADRYRFAGEGAEVGGDFYDVFETGGDSWAVVIGDVCGKGADAAALTALARYTLRAAAVQTGTPSTALAMLNEAILRQRTDGRFCTVAYADLKIGDKSARATISCGGHPAPLVVRRDGTVEPVISAGTLLGVFPDPTLSDVSTELHEGDALVFFTDGVIEARANGKMAGVETLIDLLGTCAGLTAAEIADRILESALEQHGGTASDDIAILVARVV